MIRLYCEDAVERGCARAAKIVLVQVEVVASEEGSADLRNVCKRTEHGTGDDRAYGILLLLLLCVNRAVIIRVGGLYWSRKWTRNYGSDCTRWLWWDRRSRRRSDRRPDRRG